MVRREQGAYGEQRMETEGRSISGSVGHQPHAEGNAGVSSEQRGAFFYMFVLGNKRLKTKSLSRVAAAELLPA